MEDENVNSSMERKGLYNKMAFFIRITQLFILSYDKTRHAFAGDINNVTTFLEKPYKVLFEWF